MTDRVEAAALDLGRYLRRGDAVVMGQACGEPSALLDALIAQGAAIGDLTAFIATSFSGAFTPETADAFSLHSMGAIGALRAMTKANRLQVIPCHVGQVGPLIEHGTIACDVAMIQDIPADGQGKHSMGLIIEYVEAAIARVRSVHSELN